MREIKFRAWDREEKKMYCPDKDGDSMELYHWDKVSTQGKPFETGDTIGLELALSGGYEMMQYTGLKDKNGKEIYEGDILRYHSPGGKKGAFDGELSVADWEMLVGGRLDENQNYYGVIGNIYQNPELIT